LGLFDKYSQARSFKNTLVREGVGTAAVRVYLDGKLLTRSQILSLGETYPDLKEYILYENE